MGVGFFFFLMFWNSLGISEWDDCKNSLKLDTTELLFLAQLGSGFLQLLPEQLISPN